MKRAAIALSIVIGGTLAAALIWQLFFVKMRKDILLGIALDGYPISEERLAALDSEIGFTPSIIEFYLQWPEQPGQGQFPMQTLVNIINRGSMPCLTWEPFFISGNREMTITVEAVLSGAYDGYLKQFGTEASKLEKPILVRLGHEMNLDRYHWGSGPEAFGEQSPERFKELYRYVVTYVRKFAGDRIKWVFSPNAESVPAAKWNEVRNYYPGDEFVDVLGMDGYGWRPDLTSPPKSFRDLFLPLYQDLRMISASKPLMVFETATAGTASEKEEWLRAAYETSERWGLEGIIWFHVNKEEDWRFPPMNPQRGPLSPWVRPRRGGEGVGLFN